MGFPFAANAKANAATAIPELIQVASNPAFEENRKEKHNKNTKYGWYRYDVRFALPVYDENVLIRYNIFHARLLINHAENGRKYLYDILAVKKKRASRSKMYGENPFLISDNKPFPPFCKPPILNFSKSHISIVIIHGALPPAARQAAVPESDFVLYDILQHRNHFRNRL